VEGEKRKHSGDGSSGGAARAKCDSGGSNGTIHLQNAERNPLKTKAIWKAKVIHYKKSCKKWRF